MTSCLTPTSSTARNTTEPRQLRRPAEPPQTRPPYNAAWWPPTHDPTPLVPADPDKHPLYQPHWTGNTWPVGGNNARECPSRPGAPASGPVAMPREVAPRARHSLATLAESGSNQPDTSTARVSATGPAVQTSVLARLVGRSRRVTLIGLRKPSFDHPPHCARRVPPLPSVSCLSRLGFHAAAIRTHRRCRSW
jgi:hypothetical protein